MSSSRHFVFTCNNYTDEKIRLLSNLNYRYLVYGKEVAPTTGTPHLQGHVDFHDKISVVPLRKKLQGFDVNYCRSLKNLSRSHNYCKKGDQSKDEWNALHEDGPNYGKNADVFEDGDPPMTSEQKGDKGKEIWIDIKDSLKRKVDEIEIFDKYPTTWANSYKAIAHLKKLIDNKERKQAIKDNLQIEPKWWYEEALKRLDQQNYRQILWIVDFSGDAGKSQFAKWLMFNRDAFVTGPGKNNDICHQFNCQQYSVFDYPKDGGHKIQYDLIEMFKNGMIVDYKYEGGIKYVVHPKVIVLCNENPDMSKFTQGRIDLFDVTNPVSVRIHSGTSLVIPVSPLPDE